MPQYGVKMTKIPQLEIGKSDVIFHIVRDDEKLGSLRVSKGNIVWTPANMQYSYWLNWNDFNKIVMDNGQVGKTSF